MNVSDLTLQESQEKLLKKEISPLELVTACLDRLKKTEPQIHACLTVCEEEALSQARILHVTKEAIADQPLLGIPVTLKDNYCIRGIRTTAASHVLDAYLPVHTATVWQRLKDAGAILLAKTNLDAWAHGSSTETSDYGATLNPWDITKLSGGSSGGSAASVAAGQSPLSMGSETAGSIRMPASWCGVVGLKPTYGRTSRYGIIAMGSSLDCPGPMTRCVWDAARVLNVIAGHDAKDATTADTPVPDYTQSLARPIKGLKLGYCRDYFSGVHPDVAGVVQKAFTKLKELGAEIIEIDLFDPSYAVAVYTIIQRGEVSSNLARFDGIRYGADRQRFGEEAKRRIMLGTYVLSSGYYDAYYTKAEKVRTVIMNDFARAFSRVDAIIAPTLPTVALPVGASVDQPMFGEIADMLQEPSSIAGLPGISIPCGFSQQLPVGLQIIGPQFAEERILQIAYAYEQSTDWHRQRPTV